MGYPKKVQQSYGESLSNSHLSEGSYGSPERACVGIPASLGKAKVQYGLAVNAAIALSSEAGAASQLKVSSGCRFENHGFKAVTILSEL